MNVIELDRSDLKSIGPTLHDRLAAGEIFKIKSVDEVTILRDMMVQSLSVGVCKDAGEELQKWTDSGVAPCAKTAYEFAQMLREMKRRFVFPAVFSEFFDELDFPKPVSVECGAPRFNLPALVKKGFLELAEQEDPSLIRPLGDDPTFHHILTDTAYPHRDVGRPQLSFQANLWCGFQDLHGENNSLMFFPKALRDIEHDRNHYAYDPLTPPENWGFGSPLQVPLKFGEVLLFNGDHFHSTPVPNEGSLRLSVEIRLVSQCHDDRGWYRLGFLNLNNFLPREDDTAEISIAARAAEVWHHGDNETSSKQSLTAAKCLIDLCYDQALDVEKIDKTLSQMMLFPFTEDRFVWPHFWLQKNNPDGKGADAIQDYVINNSENYFWLLIFGGFALAAGRYEVADRAFERSLLFAAQTKVDTSSNAVNYFDALSKGKSSLMPMLYELTPEDVEEVIRLFKSGAMTKGCDAQSVELVPGFPFVKGMMKLYFPYLQYFPLGRRTGFETKLAILILWLRSAASWICNRNTHQFEPRRLEVGNNWLPY